MTPDSLSAQMTDGDLAEVQGLTDDRQIPIESVGIKGLRYPVKLLCADQLVQSSVGTYALMVALPAHQKGTHMSRFLTLLGQINSPLTLTGLGILGLDMLTLLEAQQGSIEVQFPFFMTKQAPVTRAESLLDYQVTWRVHAQPYHVSLQLTVRVPVTSLCPCSKKISAYGAHNQRSEVTVQVTHLLSSSQLRSGQHADLLVTIEDLIHLIEKQASCEVFGLLKRADEKWVTERAYDNPKFVEDVVRDIAIQLKADARISSYVIEAENFESIHNHSAYARISS